MENRAERYVKHDARAQIALLKVLRLKKSMPKPAKPVSKSDCDLGSGTAIKGEGSPLPAVVPFPLPDSPPCFPLPLPFPLSLSEEAPLLPLKSTRFTEFPLDAQPLPSFKTFSASTIAPEEEPTEELVDSPFSFGAPSMKLHSAEPPRKFCWLVNPSEKVTYLFAPLEWLGMLSARAKAGEARTTARSNVACCIFNVLLLSCAQGLVVRLSEYISSDGS